MIASNPASRSVRPSARRPLAVASLLALLLASSRGFAQAEAQKPAPNVLLLVDSSGSMEFKTNGQFPSCTPGNTLASEKSRWIELVEVLTGNFNNYSCWAQSRSSTAFRTEFSLGGVAPYDYGYVNPYHRALSGNCVYGPGVAPPLNAPYSWPTGAVNKFPLSSGVVDHSQPGCAAFSQTSEGLLDVYKDLVRFGLMTFDARVSSGTGVASGAANYTTGFDGNWSYYLGSAVTGHPGNCPDDPPQEVGARNAAAPPWEGRMIPFGAPNSTAAENSARNAQIQEVLLSTRPYGATPIAGQLDDALKFLWSDTTADPLNSTLEFGPTNDPNWRAPNCRKTILILLTDGEPNLDLRPFCEAVATPTQTAGRCPYLKPAQIVAELRNPTKAPTPSMAVETYVVGFALGHVQPVEDATPGGISCDQLTDAMCINAANNVAGETRSKNIQACCTLNEIAAAGADTPRKAYFADNRAQLKAIFTDILDDVIQVATRTMPVFSSPGGDVVSKGFKFFSAFDPRPDPSAPRLWSGILERRRFVCTDALEPTTEYDPLDGDDFAANLNSQAGPSRRFYSVIGDGTASGNSMRPFITADSDGVGTGTGHEFPAANPGALIDANLVTAMETTATTCTGLTAAACGTRILKHLVGVPDSTNPSRCSGSTCDLFGAIYHSVPTPVPGRPSELLRDESYQAFATEMAAIARPSVLYTSTVDGFLHAFNLAPFPDSDDAEEDAVDTKENNELWSFLPPAVLPVLHTQYPNTPAVLLDGVPIIKDVVATYQGSGSSAVLQGYERLRSDAEAGTGRWSTVLVQGFGGGQVPGGYFALDVTRPDPDATGGKPTFRWQLTKKQNGTALFGQGGTPLITTLFLDQQTGGPREVAVAVLPGGDAAAVSGTAATIGDIMETEPSDLKTVRPVRNYTGAENARSLTIVRLDTGAIVRTFRPSTAAAAFSSAVFKATDIPAPITGQPKAYPEVTGAVADRIYVGDRDGRLWRVDVSSQNPTEWTMQVFYDAFSGQAVAASQPVYLPPVLSVDDVGDVTVAFATGSQELDNTQNRVVSLTEKLVQDDDETKFVAHVNWFQDLAVGDRVTGPMVLFNSGLYYAVSHPPATSGAACDVGSSKIIGTHYIQSADYEEALSSQPPVDPQPSTGPAPAPGRSNVIIRTQPGLVFGVSLEAEPSCASEIATIGGNESFGYGTVQMAQTVNPGKYFLSFDASGNTSGSSSRGVLEVRQELDSPHLPVTFDSWAVVYE